MATVSLEGVKDEGISFNINTNGKNEKSTIVEDEGVKENSKELATGFSSKAFQSFGVI